MQCSILVCYFLHDKQNQTVVDDHGKLHVLNEYIFSILTVSQIITTRILCKGSNLLRGANHNQFYLHGSATYTMTPACSGFLSLVEKQIPYFFKPFTWLLNIALTTDVKCCRLLYACSIASCYLLLWEKR